MFVRNKFLTTTTFVTLLLLSQARAQVNQNCSGMLPICTDPGITFTANTGVSIEPGNEYDCLSSQPNPTWYYFEIDNPGNINMNLWAPSDIDYVIYGPFDDLAEANSYCGVMGIDANAPVVDCSYSGTNNEFPDVMAAMSGEIYVMLITNYAAVVQPITLTQVGGLGTTTCDSVIANCADAGTYAKMINDVIMASPLTLYLNQELTIFSNANYTLPTETIPQPVGDGIYTAEILWLVYDSAPVSGNPSVDPGFLNYILIGDSLTDINNSTSPIIQNWGCGNTFWFVPVTADDGIGGNNNIANGATDNGGLHWDRNGNDCYDLGTPIMITYDCLPNYGGIESPELVSMFFTNGILNIQNLQEGATLTIYDLSGKLVAMRTVENGSNSISNLPAGNYIFELSTTEADQVLTRQRIVILN